MRRPIPRPGWLGLVALAACPVVAGAPARNLFRELLGVSEAQATARIEAVWDQFTRGDKDDERLYYEAADGTAYIADIGNGDVRSEGMSYGMMIAVQLDRQDQFDRLWKWARTHMRHADGPRRGYFAWHCTFGGRQLDPGSASDGEEWLAMALLFAAHRWGSHDIDYAGAAQELLREMRLKPSAHGVTPIFDATRRQVVFAPTPPANQLTDPSYHLPHFYAQWARWDRDREGRAFWAACAAESRAFFRRNAHPGTGLMSEYAHFDGRPYADGRFGAGKDEFGFDAVRTLAHVALDHAWGSRDRWQVEQSDRVLRFLGRQGDRLANRYTLDGRPLSHASSPCLVAMAAAAGVAASDPELARPFVKRLWEAPTPTGKWRYYDGLLTLFGLLQASGRYQVFDAAVATQPRPGR